MSKGEKEVEEVEEVEEKQVKEPCKKWSSELRVSGDKSKEAKIEWSKEEELISSVNHYTYF